MSVAEVLEPLVRTALNASPRVRIECWDGSVLGPPDGVLRIRFVRRRALRWLLWSPNELGFARAYVAGDIEIEGDIVAAISGLDALANSEQGPGVRVDAAAKAAIVKAVLRLGAVGPPPRPPAEESRLSRWRRHTPGRDARAISHHYDVGNDFYALILGASMVYSAPTSSSRRPRTTACRTRNGPSSTSSRASWPWSPASGCSTWAAVGAAS